MDPRTVPWTELVAAGRADGWTELAWAVENLEIDEVRRLLEAGSDPNEAVHLGQTTILHLALYAEGTIKSYDDYSFGCEITTLLVHYGADVTAPNARGERPLGFARHFLDTGASDVLADALRRLNSGET